MMKHVKQIPLRMLALAVGLLLAVSASAQTIAVQGHVKDATGEPVIGATVRVAGQTGGTVTDYDGNFTISAPAGSELQVTFVGYKVATVTAAAKLTITLEDDSQVLDNVIVIGYGRAKKEDLTGSVTAINPDEMSKGITNNATDMLVGKVAGVDVQTYGGTPGAGAQIRIRGGASFSASNDPLYVIDGLVIDNNTATGMSNILANINPQDIETFTVLKDASAAAIYGSRASNGVIIITTKKGKSGQAPKFTYNGDVTVSMIQKKYDVMNAAEYKALLTEYADQFGYDVSLLGDADTDWQDEIFRTSVSTSHSLSMQGGLKNMPYRISAGYNLSNGILITSWMRRFNASVNLAPSLLNQHLNFNITMKYMYEKDRYADSGAVGNAIRMAPTSPVYGDSDDYWVTGGYYQDLINASYSDPDWTKTTNSNATQNPVAQLRQKKCIANSNDFSGNIDVDYKIHGFEDLHIHASIGAQYTATDQSDVYSRYSYDNNYYGSDGMTYYWKYNIVANAYLQYAHQFGVHGLDIMAGAEDSHYHRSGYSEGQRTDYYTGEANNAWTREDQEWATHNSLVSYFGRINYNLLDRYLITATFRADGSSRFSEGNKWGYFPSAALAWKIANEPFLKNVKWLNDLKLRLGWGMTGQQNGIDDFYYAATYVRSDSYAMYPFGDTYYYTTRPSKYNNDLTWEKTTTYNAGIDFSALNNRFTASVDAYYRKTTDLLATVSVPVGTTFGDELMKNVGSLENYGVEFTFDVKPIVTKNFTWDLTYNIGWNHNEVTELDAGAQDWIWSSNTISRGNGTTVQKNAVGEALNTFFVYQQVYDEDGKPIEGCFVDRNADGQITDDDRYYYKDPAPDVTMGLTSKFIYKRWDFSFALRASLGNYVFYDFLSNSAILGGLYTNGAFSNSNSEAAKLGFTGTTTIGNYLSDYYVRNASFLKCTNITLGYSFPALLRYASRDYFDGRVYLTVQNPFIITSYDGIDPEVTSGVDSGVYPRPFSIQIGVNFNF